MTPLSGKKVRIRPFEQEDRKLLFKWWNNPDSQGEFITGRLESSSEFEKYLGEVVFGQHHTTILIIERLDNSTTMGNIFFWPSPDGDYGITLGYALAEPDQRSKGYMTEAVSLVVNYLFMSRNIERIAAETDVENFGSQKVLEKNGFKREGVLRKHGFVKGVFRDDIQFSLIREDWKALQSKGSNS